MVTRTFPRTLAVVTLVALGAHAQPRPAPAVVAPPAPVAPAPAPMTPAPVAPAPIAAGPVAPAPSPPADPGQVTVPRLHHAPPAVAPTHTALAVAAEIDFPHLVRRAVVLYRSLPSLGYPASPEFFEGEFLRGAPGPYVAIIPAEAVRAPGLEYTIELELVDARRVSVFATRDAPHRVVVSEDLMDVREHAALERLGGRRSVVSTFIEGVDFGPSTASGGANVVKDRYYRVEAAYTYRPLRTVDEFSVRVGIVRGYSPVPVDSTLGITDRYPVGLNYAAPSLKFRVADLWRLEGELLTSITELGFSLGAGGAVDVGDPYGSKLRVGFETVKTFGTRFFSQVDIQAGDRVRLSPIIEATDMPHADRFGVRLIGEVAYDFGNGFFGALRGGYQARDATSGGPSGGLRAGYAF